MAGPTIRHFIDLIEAAQTAPWSITRSGLFDGSLATMLPKFPGLRDKLKRFIDIKLPNPLNGEARVGKSDRPFTGILVGYWHCHLAADAILIYRLQNHSVELTLLCQHADIEGKRAKAILKRLPA